MNLIWSSSNISILSRQGGFLPIETFNYEEKDIYTIISLCKFIENLCKVIAFILTNPFILQAFVEFKRDNKNRPKEISSKIKPRNKRMKPVSQTFMFYFGRFKFYF